LSLEWKTDEDRAKVDEEAVTMKIVAGGRSSWGSSVQIFGASKKNERSVVLAVDEF
jgi:hypothetical protein